MPNPAPEATLEERRHLARSLIKHHFRCSVSESKDERSLPHAATWERFGKSHIYRVWIDRHLSPDVREVIKWINNETESGLSRRVSQNNVIVFEIVPLPR